MQTRDRRSGNGLFIKETLRNAEQLQRAQIGEKHITRAMEDRGMKKNEILTNTILLIGHQPFMRCHSQYAKVRVRITREQYPFKVTRA